MANMAILMFWRSTLGSLRKIGPFLIWSHNINIFFLNSTAFSGNMIKTILAKTKVTRAQSGTKSSSFY